MLAAVLDALCRLLHPIIPFVTEQVWQGLNAWRLSAAFRAEPAAESVCIAAWPRRWAGPMKRPAQTVEQWCEVIKALRNLKAERNVPKDAKIAPIWSPRATVAEWLLQGEPFLTEPVTGRVGDDRLARSIGRPIVPSRFCRTSR